MQVCTCPYVFYPFYCFLRALQSQYMLWCADVEASSNNTQSICVGLLAPCPPHPATCPGPSNVTSTLAQKSSYAAAKGTDTSTAAGLCIWIAHAEQDLMGQKALEHAMKVMLQYDPLGATIYQVVQHCTCFPVLSAFVPKLTVLLYRSFCKETTQPRRTPAT